MPTRTAILISFLLAACASPNGLLVSEDATPLGGNLFVETSGQGDRFLVLDGEITPMTSYVFQSLLEQAEIEGLVIAQSPGGDIFASIQIGRALNREKMDTVVLIDCVSACVDVFIAGHEREMSDIAELGLHSATDTEALEVHRRYWAEFSDSRIIERAYDVPNDNIWIIDAPRAMELGLATNILKPES